MKRSPFVLSSLCLIAASSCGQNAHVTRVQPATIPSVLTTAQVPGTVSWAMLDATTQDCPNSGQGMVLKKFIDKNGNGKLDPGEQIADTKTVCSGTITHLPPGN